MGLPRSVAWNDSCILPFEVPSKVILKSASAVSRSCVVPPPSVGTIDTSKRRQVMARPKGLASPLGILS